MGTLQIEWDNVVEVTAPEYFEVEDLEGSLYFGSLQPGRSPGTLEVVADWEKDAVLIHRVARIQLVKSSFWDRFRGSIDAGAGYTSATESSRSSGRSCATGGRSTRPRPPPTPC